MATHVSYINKCVYAYAQGVEDMYMYVRLLYCILSMMYVQKILYVYNTDVHMYAIHTCLMPPDPCTRITGPLILLIQAKEATNTAF